MENASKIRATAAHDLRFPLPRTQAFTITLRVDLKERYYVVLDGRLPRK